jgi:hypothetical protein
MLILAVFFLGGVDPVQSMVIAESCSKTLKQLKIVSLVQKRSVTAP